MPSERDKIQPAFPQPDHLRGRGMTLRDYFAGQALSSLIERHEGDWSTAVRLAYETADFMLYVRTADEATGKAAKEST